MRQVREERQWNQMQKARAPLPDRPVEVSEGLVVDLSEPCTVVGGRNGAGKSRLLRELRDRLGDTALLLDMHRLCENALEILRSRDDFDEMADEFGVIGPDGDRQNDVERIVGREYESIEWFALEISPSDESVAEQFTWNGDQPLLPYFRVERGLQYTSRDMGLGEFAVHFVFWILEHYKEQADLVLLLDEPDAYLPPVGVSAFLARLLRLCEGRGWVVVISTHSQEMIQQAVDHDAFLHVTSGSDGQLVGTHSKDDVRVAETLLARPPKRFVLFCEDESALWLLRVILDRGARPLGLASECIWGDGYGYLEVLHKTIPRVPRGEIGFCYVFDGDRAGDLPGARDDRWSAIALPTSDDPDSLFKGLSADPEGLAAKLACEEGLLRREIDSLQGSDAHDWVNGLGELHGRQRTLQALAELWCDAHPDQVSAFCESMSEILSAR